MNAKVSLKFDASARPARKLPRSYGECVAVAKANATAESLLFSAAARKSWAPRAVATAKFRTIG